MTAGRLKIYEDGDWKYAGFGVKGDTGPQGTTGAAGPAGPNSVSTSTTTAINGLLKGNGSTVAQASAGTDYLAPAGNGSALTGITENQVANLVTDLASKEPSVSPTTSDKYYRGDKTFQTLNQDVVPDGVTNKAYTAIEKAKLAGVATGATANSSDATLLGRANHTGTQTASTISDFSAAADARITNATGTSIASLSAGKVPSSQLPAVSLTTVQTAASQAAQLALTAQEGDVVVRTDLNQTYMHNGGSAGTMADYTLLNTPADAVTSVAGQTGVVVLSKADVGLSNVDNTADGAKPVSTAQAAAIATKEPAVAAGSTSQYYRGDKSWQTLDKTAVGLANVDNTSDMNKPVSTAQASADAAVVSSSAQRAANLSDLASASTARTNLGLGTAATISATASGDLSGTLPSPTVAKVQGVAVSATAPTGSGQVLTSSSTSAAAWATPASAPVTSVAGKTGVVTLVESDIASLTSDLAAKEPTLAAGTTGQYYRGDKSFQTLDRSAVGLANVDNTSDVNKPVSSAQQTALNAKADDSSVLHLAGTETVSGVKTYTEGPILADFTSTTPTAPTAGSKIFTRKRAGRGIPSFIGTTNKWSQLQPGIWSNKTGIWTAAGNGTSIGGYNFTNAASGTPTAVNVATTNLFTSMRRIQFLSAASTFTTAGTRYNAAQFWRGNAAGLGGFFYVARWGISIAQANHRVFVGLSATATTLSASAEISSLFNLVGFGNDAADSSLYFMHNDGSGTATKETLTGTFPSNTSATDMYETRIFCAPNDTTIYYSIERLGQSDFFEGSVTTDIPSNTTLLSPQIHMTTNSGSAAVAIDVVTQYIETDY